MSFSDEIKTTDKCTFPYSWLQNLVTVWSSKIFDNIASVQPHGCHIKGILMYHI
jgi:hypothetical protein